MKSLSTGTGLALLAGAIAVHPLVSSLGSNANAFGVGTTPVTAVAAAATAQGAPTIVWYGHSMGDAYSGVVVRAWSDGRVEGLAIDRVFTGCDAPTLRPRCSWQVLSAPAQGLTFDADLNFDEAVDGSDLGLLLAKWGPAPRNPAPPSDCPLALINP